MKQDGHNSAGKSVRDQHGRFLPGNPGNVAGLGGRPPRAVEDRYLETLRAECTPDRWGAIVKRAIVDAAQGDTAARTWLSKYLLPEPSHNVNIGGTLADLLAALADRPDTPLDD